MTDRLNVGAMGGWVIAAVPPQTALWVMMSAEMGAVVDTETVLTRRSNVGPTVLVGLQHHHGRGLEGAPSSHRSLPTDPGRWAKRVWFSTEGQNGGHGLHTGDHALDEADGGDQDQAPDRDLRRPDPGRTALRWLMFMAVS